MQLHDVISAIRRFKLLAAAILAAFIAGGYAAAYARPAQYKATSILIASPKKGDFNAIAGVQFMLPAVVQQVSTAAFEARTIAAAGVASSPADITVAASQDAGTGIIKVTATGANQADLPAVSAAAARQLIASKLTPSVRLVLLQAASGASSVTAAMRIPILAAATLLGILAAVFGSLGAATLRGKKVQVEGLPDEFDLETVARIPKRRLRSAAIPQTFADPRLHDFSESFYRLVTNLESMGSFRTSRHIAVISAARGDGKTTVAAGLAYALASHLPDEPVLAIDMDLRRPSLHERLGLTRSISVGETVETLPTELPNLDVVPAAATGEHPLRLTSRVLPRLLERYDDAFVIVDTPPLSVPEATLVAHMVGSVVLVLDPGGTQHAELARTMHMLRRANVRVLGTVLNRSAEIGRWRPYTGVYSFGAATLQAFSTDVFDEQRETPGRVGGLRG